MAAGQLALFYGFAKVTTSMIWSLQTLRFVAAAMVVYVHAAQSAVATTGSVGVLPLSIVGLGLTGVDIFFVISGVVIAKTAHSFTPLEFAWRRARRILPIYYLFSVFVLLVELPSSFGWRELLATFLLWPATDVMTQPILGIAWTLSFEMLFYGCAALVLADRRFMYVLLAGYAVAFTMRESGQPVFQFLGNPLILEFLFGVAIAKAPAWRQGIWFMPLGFAVLIFIGFAGLAPEGKVIDFLRGAGNLQRVFLVGIPAALIVYGAVQWRTQASIWTYLGDTSYTLYLSHIFVLFLLEALWARYPMPADFIIAATMFCSIALAWRLYELIEKPILSVLPKQLQVVSTMPSRRPKPDAG